MEEPLGNREREVLRAIVREYVSSGEPVGSSAIAPDVSASPATVRNVMADLEELGFLEKPHTSAGRIPTDRGYRYFVDTFVQARMPSRSDREAIDAGLPARAVADELLRETARLLNSLSHHAAVVMTAGSNFSRIVRVEFVRLREGRVLAVLLSELGMVQNRLLTIEFPVTADELAKASNYLNELLARAPLEDVRERIVAEMAEERTEYDALAKKALTLGQKALDGGTESQVTIEGQTALYDAPDFADVGRMRALVRLLEERSKLLTILDRTLEAREIKIFIGSEADLSVQTGISVIAAPYASDDAVVGCLGVIGPTRMNYSRVIPLVDYTARVVSKLLETNSQG